MYTHQEMTKMNHRQAAQHVVKTLDKAGYTTYFAGGWVRDFIMQHPSDDIDIATSASVQQIQQLFSQTIPVGIAFGIVIVVVEHHHFEVATFRQDHAYIDGRRPTGITSASAEEDAQRRDFTINGLFYDPLREKIFDYVGGLDDIRKGIIRAIGDPIQRLSEDKLRMMRAVRYSTRFGFLIEPTTSDAIFKLSSFLVPSVAMERVWQEFKKMSYFSHFDKGLIALHQLNLLPTIFPALRDFSTEQIQKRVEAIQRFPKEAPTIAQLLELFPHCSLQDALEVCDKLKLSKADRTFVEFYLHALRLMDLPSNWKTQLEPLEWAYFYAHLHAELVLSIIASRLESSDPSKFLLEHRHYKHKLRKAVLRIQTGQPLIRAQHLIAEGVKPGPQLGYLLKEAERIAVNEEIEDPHLILEKLKKSSFWK